VLASPLPGVVRQGQQVVVQGRYRGRVVTSSQCASACHVFAALEGDRTDGSTSPNPWRILARTPDLAQHNSFVLSWRVPRRFATGPLMLRVVIGYLGHGVAVTRPVRSFVGPAPVYCAPPVPPFEVHPGEGWIVGGSYIEGGPFPGVDECESSSYTVTVTEGKGAVLASQQVPGFHSYEFVLPAGAYTLKAGCGVPTRVTVSAGKETRADTYCLVP
jgi:hypothetical protein